MRAGRALGDALSVQGPRQRVPPVALLLGLSGLLPVAGALVAVMQQARGDKFVAMGDAVARAEIGYATLILSFLGGMWWGQASRSGGELWVYVAAVTPTLALVALYVLMKFFAETTLLVPSLVIGVTVLATLPVDALLTRREIAPTWWMRLRVPLSLGLGFGTILVGVLAPS